MNDAVFMKEAILEAKKAAKKGEVPIGAIIVYNDKIIARAHNLKESKLDASAHAEILAIQKASKKLNNWRLLNCKLYVTLEPCSMCASAIQQARIAEVIYALKDPHNGAIDSGAKLYQFKSINKPPRVKSGVLKNEAKHLIASFFRNRR